MKDQEDIVLNLKPFFVYFFTILFSILFIVFGNRICQINKTLPENNKIPLFKAKIIEVYPPIEENILDETTNENAISKKIINFKCKVLSGENKGKIIEANQTFDNLTITGLKPVEKNDKIIVFDVRQDEMEDSNFVFGEYVRSDAILILAIFFIILLIAFGRLQGINTVISLVLTCAAIFMVLIPSVFAGFNIYLSSIVVSSFIIIMTLLIIYGASTKSLIAGLGCFFGILFTGFLTFVMNHILNLSGVVNDESVYLLYIKNSTPIDLRAIIFASIIIGAMGAIMDVAMSISSALHEIKEKIETPTFDIIFKSGLSIGRDIMGTMANTLILAYIGSSMSLVLILVAYNPSTYLLFNKEFIAVEILQALVGSFGLLFSIPFTSLISGLIIGKKN